jgi:hypothetical protein
MEARPVSPPSESLGHFVWVFAHGDHNSIRTGVAEALKRHEAIYARLDCPPLIRVSSWWIGSRPVIPIM